MTDPLLAVRGLTKRFGGLTAVDDVSFDVESESITGLIGPNGAGKTTLFNLVSGFERPDSGVVELRGRDLQDVMERDDQERRIGLLSSGIVCGVLGGAGAALVSLPGAYVGPAGLLVGSVGAVTYARGRDALDYPRGPRSRPYQVARQGLMRTFQITRELNGMTVTDNMLLAAQSQDGERLFQALFRRRSVEADEEALRARANELLELLELDHVAEDYAASLSGGQRKLLELGRVLMAEPDIVLLDEPVAGVNPALTEKLVARIKALRKEGYTFLVIEHDMDMIMDVSDTLIVMNNGEKILEGTPEKVRSSEAVVEAYLGE